MKFPFNRICADCGDVKPAKYKPKKGVVCKKCLPEKTKSIVKIRWKNHIPKKHFYFCPNCEYVKSVARRRRTLYCGDCSRSFSKKPKIKITFDFQTMKTENAIKVKPRAFKKVNAVKKSRPTRSLKPSKQAIAKVIEVNRKHRAEVQRETKAPIPQKLSDAEMIKKFLKKKKPSVVDNSEMKDIVPVVYMQVHSGVGGIRL